VSPRALKAISVTPPFGSDTDAFHLGPKTATTGCQLGWQPCLSFKPFKIARPQIDSVLPKRKSNELIKVNE